MGSYASLSVCPSVSLSVCLWLYQNSIDNNSREKNSYLSLRFDHEVKGHMCQGQRSRGSRSNKGYWKRQVGSRQRQVASLIHVFVHADRLMTLDLFVTFLVDRNNEWAMATVACSRLYWVALVVQFGVLFLRGLLLYILNGHRVKGKSLSGPQGDVNEAAAMLCCLPFSYQYHVDL